MSDKIEAMMNTKDVIERWRLERALNWELMSEEEKARWKARRFAPHSFSLTFFIIGLVAMKGDRASLQRQDMKVRTS